MPIYTCSLCGKCFPQKSNYVFHINRKTKCIQKSTETDLESPNQTNGIKCNYCNKEFTRKDALKRHMETRCKVKKSNNEKMEEILSKMIEMEKEIVMLRHDNNVLKHDNNILKKDNEIFKKQITINGNNNSVGNSSVNNITLNNAVIVPFGSEDMTKITKKELEKIIERGINSVGVLIEKLHFDVNKPENHNVYISNLRDNYIIIYDGEKWKLKDRNEILHQLYEDGADFLEVKFNELIDKLDDASISKFKRFINCREDNENEIEKKIKKDLKALLYENKKIVEETRKKNEKCCVNKNVYF